MDKKKELEFLVGGLIDYLEKNNLTKEEIKEALLTFKSAVDLSWFIIEEKLEEKCLIPKKISPRDLYRLAKDFKIISNIDDWLEMHKAAFQVLQINDENELKIIFENVKDKYVNLLKNFIQMIGLNQTMKTNQ